MEEIANDVAANVNDAPIDILLVEDEEADIKITLRAFNQAKIKNSVYTVRDGQEALDFIRHEGKYREGKFPTPDLILLDIQLPKVDGFEVLKQLKQDERFDFIPVAIFTSSKPD